MRLWRDPQRRGFWCGHAVLYIQEMAAVFDPTIGQGRYATTDLLRCPLLLRDPVLVVPPRPGVALLVRAQ
jgi:hypothetical protein